MPPDVIEGIMAITAMLSLGGFTLIGLRMFLRYREARLRIGQGGDTEQLTQALEGLQEQIFSLRGEVTDLHERIDFAERLLTRGGQDVGGPPAKRQD